MDSARIARRPALRLALAAGLAGVLGCSTVAKRGPALLPTAHQLKAGPFILHSNGPIDPDAPPVRALEALRSDLASRLDGAPDDDPGPVEVFVLDDRNAFLHLLRFYFPELPPRRAFFMAQDDQRIVYTFHGPLLEEDLRHEAAHALLRGRFGDIPLWLDEGLAEYFEAGPDDLQDRNDRLARLSSDGEAGWKPDLRRLETLDEVHQMAPRDYREAWAWVDLLLSDPRRGKPLLLDHLRSRDERTSLTTALADRGVDAATRTRVDAGRGAPLPPPRREERLRGEGARGPSSGVSGVRAGHAEILSDDRPRRRPGGVVASPR